MGGLGSGRIAEQPTLEACDTLALNVNKVMRCVWTALRKSGLLPLPPDAELTTSTFPWGWMRPESTEPWAVVMLQLKLGGVAGTAQFVYDIKHLSCATGPQDYTVHLLTTPCRFGGVRWWWVCPQTSRRVSKLCLPNGGTKFLSRGPGGYQLAYASQREDEYGRAHRRGRRIRRRLGGVHTDARSPVPEKPPRMRQATYARLQRQLWDIETILDKQLDEFEAR
jgi:hypothetical protein